MAEAAWLGLAPGTVALADGPLIVSAFGYDPPERSVHFELSLMSLEDGIAHKLKDKFLPDELEAVWEATQKLNTKSLTAVRGEASEHGLVWEDGSIELGTEPSADMDGKPIAGFLPEGDGEKLLRRFIDDGVNLLTEFELNRIRLDEGLQPLNLWWPWGQGFRTRTPNLALKRGEVCQVESASIRLQGLTRLCGYRHGDRARFRTGLRTDFDYLFGAVARAASSIAVIEAFGELRSHKRLEEMEWFGKELDRKLLEPLAQLARKEPVHLTILASANGPNDGLVMDFFSDSPHPNSIPFDERALEERSLQTVADWGAVNDALIS